jgi:hypothetical protein
MIKYHKEIGFKREDVILAQVLIDRMKDRQFFFSKHSLRQLREENEAEAIGQRIIGYSLCWDDVFELAIDNGRIEKIGFRIPFKDRDIVFIVNREKIIVTLWTNDKKDVHFTLNVSNYAMIK